MASDDRGKALDLAFTQIEKQFGKGSIMKLGQADALKGISVISYRFDFTGFRVGCRWSTPQPHCRNIRP